MDLKEEIALLENQKKLLTNLIFCKFWYLLININ